MRKLFRYLTSFKGPIALVIGLVFIQSMAELYLPTLMAKIIDTGVIKHDIPFILRIGGMMLLVAFAGTICSVSASYFSAKVAMSFGKMLRSKVFTHAEGFSLLEFGQIGTASLITRTTNDITQIQVVVNMILRMMISAPLMAIGGVIMAVSVNPGLSSVIVISAPLLLTGIAFVIWRGIPLFKKVQIRLDAVNRVLREGLTGVRVIRSFNRIHYEKNRFRKANANLRDTTIKVNKLIAVLMPFMMLVMNFTTIAIVWFGAIKIDAGNMMVGDLMAFLQYAMQIMFSMVMLSMMFILIPRASASASRINEVLAIKPSIEEKPANHESRMAGTIEFKDVSFHYPGAEKPALRNLSFTARPGEVTAIIGGTGSGKSTLLKLIPRFYEPSSGSILINGVPASDYPLEVLRNKIGLVPQKAVLFTGTVKENIRFGNERATDEEIVHAAKVAQAFDFISAMNDGFDSLISQGGTNVSGGQKQRLSIARAIVRKPEIYLFDDSFSALDFKTDANLRKALKKETGDSTVLIVAQRVSTVKDADRIIVLDDGNVMGIGTHEELLRMNATYQEIVKSQLSEEEIA